MLAARLSSVKQIAAGAILLSGQHRACRRLSARVFVAPSAFSVQRRPRSSERVLRYPDGNVRIISYPVEASATDVEDDIVVGGDPYRSFAEELQPDRWGAEEWDVSDLWSGLFDETAASQVSTAASAPAVPDSKQQGADPLDVLNQLTSSSYKEVQQQYWDRISGSYQVLAGCPWVVPKPLHVLAVPQAAAPQAAMFTLQTCVPQQQLESELSKVLGRRRADGCALVSVDSLVEGIVAFEDEAAAEAFGNALEAEGHTDVSLATADSHELFRLSTSSSAVVVLMQQGVEQPTPGELEVSLRRQRRGSAAE